MNEGMYDELFNLIQKHVKTNRLSPFFEGTGFAFSRYSAQGKAVCFHTRMRARSNSHSMRIFSSASCCDILKRFQSPGGKQISGIVFSHPRCCVLQTVKVWEDPGSNSRRIAGVTTHHHNTHVANQQLLPQPSKPPPNAASPREQVDERFISRGTKRKHRHDLTRH